MDSKDLFDVLATYERDSLSHNVDVPEQAESAAVWSGIGFRLRDFYLVTELGSVAEIITMPPVTRVPGSSNWLYGVANIRGTLMSTVDLRLFFFGERTRLGKRSRVLAVRHEHGYFGLLVDEVYGLRHFEPDDVVAERQISDPVLDDFLDREYLREGRHWAVLELGKLVQSADFLHAAA